MKQLVTFILTALFSVTLIAQDKVFTVMAVQGSVANGGKTVSVGSQLGSNAVLTLGDKSYVGLLHKSGNSVEFKTAGNYELKTQHDKLASKTKGFQQKYMDYVVNGVTAKNSGGSYQRNMSVTGSVDRALAKNEIIIPLPMKVTLITDGRGQRPNLHRCCHEYERRTGGQIRIYYFFGSGRSFSDRFGNRTILFNDGL